MNINNFFPTLLNFYFRHKRLCVVAASVLVLALVFAFPDVAHAAEEPPDPEFSDILNELNKIINWLIQVSAMWLWPVILMIGSLLDNDLVFGGAMGERLLDIWVQIRNLVNIVFVLVLLAIAVYNVLGLGEEGGGSPLALKQALPKFVIALIAVNFSFLAAKVVLDFTNVITGAVFALPSTAVRDDSGKLVKLDDMVNSLICEVQSDEMPLRPVWCNSETNKLNERGKAFFSRLDRSNITIAYALRFGRAPQLKFIKEGLKGLGQLGFNIIFNATLYVVYAVSFIVLFLVLLLRVVVLWVGVVLSPLIALSIVLPNLKELAGEAGGIQEKFIQNAIAPIKIGLVLSIGYIMLDGFEADKSIHGAILSSVSLEAVDPNAIPTDIGDLQQLMIAVAVVVIVWVGVFAGAEKTMAQGITNTIKGYGQGFGKWMAKLPTYAQILPVGGKAKDILGEKASLQEIMGMVGGARSVIESTGGGPEAKDAIRKRFGLAGLSLNPEATSAWDRAIRNGYKDIALALRDHGNTVGGAGYEKLYEAIKARDKDVDTPGKFATKYGSKNDPVGLARNLWANRDLQAQLTSNDVGIKTVGDLEQKIRLTSAAGAAGGINLSTPEKVKEALADPNIKGEQLKNEDAFAGWAPSEIDALKAFPQKLRDVFAVVGGDGKIDKTKFTPALQFVQYVQAHQNETNIATQTEFKSLLAQTAATGIDKNALQAFISGSGATAVPAMITALNGAYQPPPAPGPGATPAGGRTP